MKAVILAGGLGTRISEETSIKPKPMVEIGGKPILWHILKIYSNQGVNDFIICCGYKGYLIKEYFANYFLHMSDVTIDMTGNDLEVHHQKAEPWRITLVNTGEKTMTGGRIKRIKEYICDETFFMTYGDGVADIDINALTRQHQKHRRLCTVTAVQPPGRFGILEFGENESVLGFKEKPEGDGSWINGGFFVLEPAVLDLICNDQTVWEQGPMQALAEKNELTVYRHRGFWQPMDTLRDRIYLEGLWNEDKAPWRLW